jgi:hypothetical protein
MIDRLVVMGEELFLRRTWKGRNYFLRGEKFSYDDFEAFRLGLRDGLGPNGLAGSRRLLLLGWRMALVVTMTFLPFFSIRGTVLPHPGPIPAEALNGEYGIRAKTVV